MGISSKLNGTYLPPAVEFTSENYRTVFDAISDLQDIQTSTDVSNPTPDGYVKALGGIAAGNKAQVQMESMNEITKFTF